MRIPIPGLSEERVSIPVLERHIHVVIDARYGSQQFLKRNWQWLIATLAGLGGALAAWLIVWRGRLTLAPKLGSGCMGRLT